MPSSELIYLDRELSWVAFNGRVLQEAADHANPLFERLTFLSIFSSNLDEFYRVRVASLRSLLRLGKKKRGRLDVRPKRLLRAIHSAVSTQQEEFGRLFRDEIVPELAEHGIQLLGPEDILPADRDFLLELFETTVRPLLAPTVLSPGSEAPFLENRGIYLVAKLTDPDRPTGESGPPRYGLVQIPSARTERFVVVPRPDGVKGVMFLDDLVRLCLPSLFEGYDVGEAYSVKLTRDAELYLEDDFGADVAKAIRKAVAKRETGAPSRFLYDASADQEMINFLSAALDLEDEDPMEGGRYHNLHDLARMPRFGLTELSFEPWPALPHRGLEGVPSVLDRIRDHDELLHFPYQSYDHVVRFLTEAARDPEVEEIWLTVYRVTDNSKIMDAVLRAVEEGKRVRVFVELRARFDEEANLDWAARLDRAGIITMHSIPGLKVHAKTALVVRREESKRQMYAYLGTGNFNEKTAAFYTDWGLLTADPRLTREVAKVFHYLAGEVERPHFEHCLVAPLGLREGFYDLIDREIQAAEAGDPAAITAKMNGLEDPDMIAKLYEADRAGVKVTLIVRGICCLAAGVPGQSESITVRSIVDRFLEHGRAFVFHSAGNPKVYLASSDWMQRNLSRRVEVAFPILDPVLRAELLEALQIQATDNRKARMIDSKLRNEYVSRSDDEPQVRTQEATRAWVGHLLERSRAQVTARPGEE